MTTHKFRFIAFCVLVSFFLPVAWAKKAVVFVHGRGVAQLADPAVAEAYWGNLVKIATRYEAIPTKIVHYDGTSKLSAVVPLVADQIADFIEQNKIGSNELKIYAHSYGGIVMRYIFSNGNNHDRYQKVIYATQDVTTIGAPHLGSEAADLAYQWDKRGNLGKKALVNSDEYLKNNESAQELRTTQMAYYNKQCILWGMAGCPVLPKPFFLISGGKGDLANDFFTEGHKEDLGLLTIAKLVKFSGKHDGLVAQKSAEGLTQNATIWFNTGRNHHHQRNNDYTPAGENTLGNVFERDIFL